MIRNIELSQFLRNLKVYPDGLISFFLGSGTSVQAGIPSGSTMVWDFKKEIYCSKTNTSTEKFRDLQSESNRMVLQDYFDAEGNNPKRNDPSEYSHYFEKCYSTIELRKQYIINKVRDIKPSIGHVCLGDLFINGKIKNIWTTNFDELIEAGIYQNNPSFSFRLLSSINFDVQDNIGDFNFSNLYKLHGDYRYDRIKNTLQELQSLEFNMNNIFKDSLMKGGLVMIGYSGCDESIMSILEENVDKTGFLPNGLVWLNRNNSVLQTRTMSLIERACINNENSGVVVINGSDDFLFDCYKTCNGNNLLINERWKEYSTRKLPITFSSAKADYFIKMNTFESISYPMPVSFDTDIVTWKELKEKIGASKVIAALYARKVYCFGSLSIIKMTFNNHILSEIKKEDIIPTKFLYRENSFYTSMLYNLIEMSLLEKSYIKKFGKNKYYNNTKKEIYNDNYSSYNVYEGIDVSLEFINGKYNLSIMLTIYVTDVNDNPISNDKKKTIINKKMAEIFNNKYDEKFKDWNRELRKKGAECIEFTQDGFSLIFNHACITYGDIGKSGNFPQKNAYQYLEPIITFNLNNSDAKGIHQLKGISNYGPIDFSYAKQDQVRHAIKLYVLSPKNYLSIIIKHISDLNNCIKVNKDDGFLINYIGFENIYKQCLDIPLIDDNKRCLFYNEALITSKEILLNTLKEKIDFLTTESQNISILIIYIPKLFEKFRIGGADDDFNLHDAIKLYAMDKGIRVQFIEEKSINTYEPCKVMWALSTSLYAKQGGILWRPESLNNETAFVGVSYAYSKEKGISVGCSQLFDSSGTGLRLLLRKIKDPQMINKSPFMKANEARQMMSTLRDQYYQSSPSTKLKRIVIHKTTFFTTEEIQGFTQALEGIEDIELLQIQEFTVWRGIRYKNIKQDNGVDGFSMKRGTLIQLSNDQYILWSHGCVKDNELHNGKGYNYYKGGRGIPIMIKRFYGKASGDVITKEIMMLTKMNWNSGDCLYKLLPVTLDFAKVLSRMSKQNEALYDRSYDFRYFM